MENLEKAPRRTISGYVKYNLQQLIDDCNSVIRPDGIQAIECAETLIRVRDRMEFMLSTIQDVEGQQEYALKCRVEMEKKKTVFPLAHFKRQLGKRKGGGKIETGCINRQ